MNVFRAYQLLGQSVQDGNRLLYERFMMFLVGNSILAAAWFGLISIGKFASLQVALPWIGIISCIILGAALYAGARLQTALFSAMKRMEQGPDFDYMKEIRVRPLSDIVTPAQLGLWKIGWYGFVAFPARCYCIMGYST